MSTTTRVQLKRCVKCGVDVTGQQRMKNARGEYWCMNCGGKEQSTQSASLMNPCPTCKQPVHAANLVRKDGQYVCEACASDTRIGKSSAKGKWLALLALFAAGAAAFAYFNLMPS